MSISRISIILANRIRILRNSKGWTQERLAEEARIHPTYICRIESCKKIPTLHVIVNIAEAFQVDAYELLVDTEKTEEVKYKKLKIINMVKDSSPSIINAYSALINTLNKEYKKPANKK